MLTQKLQVKNEEELAYISKLILWTIKEKEEDAKQFLKETLGVSNTVLQSRGLAILELEVQSVSAGIGNTTTVQLSKKCSNAKLSSGKFKVGSAIKLIPTDAVDLGDEDDQVSIPGIIKNLSERSITLALDDTSLELDNMTDYYDMFQSTDSTTYDRMLEALNSMKKIMGSGYDENQESVFSFWPGCPRLVSKLLSSNASTFAVSTESIVPNLNLFNNKLNSNQNKAVHHGLLAKYLSLIHGPPGTGKSATLVELIRQLVGLNVKVLVCAPSNGAVDNLLERLSDKDIKCLRFGNPAKIQIDKVTKHSLAVQIAESVYGPTLRSLRKQIDAIRSNRRKGLFYGSTSIASLTREYKEEEAKAIDYLLARTQVVFSTLNGVGSSELAGKRFDVLVIDEATQALEPDCWVAISHCNKVIIAGDHHQLPPTVLSNSTGLEVTLFQRLLELHKSHVSTMLTVQYRMHQDIMEFSSKELYGSKLIAHESVKQHLLGQLPGVKTSVAILPLVFIDTAGLEYLETSSGQSKQNNGECLLIDNHLEYLLNFGLRPRDIAVISPYNAQVGLVKKMLGKKYPGVDIGSVDGFQGREKEAVIISLVRSNYSHSVGFLRDYRRLNVAITRARRHLYIIGDSETTMQQNFYTNNQLHPQFLYKLGKYLTTKGDVQYPDPLYATAGGIKYVSEENKQGPITYSLSDITRSNISSQKREKNGRKSTKSVGADSFFSEMDSITKSLLNIKINQPKPKSKSNRLGSKQATSDIYKDLFF